MGSAELLIAHDGNAFNRWSAVQQLAQRVVADSLQAAQDGRSHGVDDNASLTALNSALSSLLADESLEPAFKAEILRLPSVDMLAESVDCVDYQQLGAAHSKLHEAVA